MLLLVLFNQINSIGSRVKMLHIKTRQSQCLIILRTGRLKILKVGAAIIILLEEMYFFTSKVGTDVDLFQKYNGQLCKINFNNAW